MIFAFAVGILSRVDIFLGLPQRDSLIFFHSRSPEIHRYDASIEYDVFFFSVVIY